MRLQDNISSHLVVPLLLRLSLSRRCHRAAIAQLRACCSPLSTPSHNLISLVRIPPARGQSFPRSLNAVPTHAHTQAHTQAQHTHSTGTDGTRSRRASAETLRRLPCPLRSFAPTPFLPSRVSPTMVRIAKSPLPHPSSPAFLLLSLSLALILILRRAALSRPACNAQLSLSLSLSQSPRPLQCFPPPYLEGEPAASLILRGRHTRAVPRLIIKAEARRRRVVRIRAIHHIPAVKLVLNATTTTKAVARKAREGRRRAAPNNILQRVDRR